jgi:hypothetical protein
MNPIRRPILVLTAGALFLAACSGVAMAQNSKPADGKDVLKGPKVKEGGVPGENRRFTGGDQKRKDQMGANIPHPLFIRAIDTLKGDSVEQSLRLTETQIKSLDEIDAGFKSSQQAYRKEHEAELMALRDKLPENAQRRLDGALGTRPERANGKPGKKAKPAEKPMDSDKSMDGDKPDSDAAQAMARVKELMEAAPKAEDTHTKMWAVLNEAQKPKVQHAIERMKNEMESRRAKGEGKEGKPPLDMNNLPPRLQERLKNMTPQEREEAIKRFQERQKKDNEKK